MKERVGRQWTNCRVPKLLFDRLIILAEDYQLAPWEVIEASLNDGASLVVSLKSRAMGEGRGE